jgi:hypothetical protein
MFCGLSTLAHKPIMEKQKNILGEIIVTSLPDTLTIPVPGNQMRHGNYFFQTYKRVFMW